ncbi:MAG: sugar phosphate isomerase/epimerase [Abditibacteriota bacterium]|nr:sugar phosphate isomerase/epimerase [Abditibacteriota bacterium]
MKAGVSSYSFGPYFGRLSKPELAAKAAEIGFEAIEFAGLGIGGDKQRLMDEAAEWKEVCASAGLEISAYCIGADFLNPRGGSLAGEIKALSDELDIAEALGVSKMRHDITGGAGDLSLMNFFRVLPVLTEGIREVTAYGKSLGIKTMFENHGFFMQNSERCRALIEEVASDNFGALIDIGNFICADDNNAVAVKRMLPYVFHVHAKDFYVKPFYEDGSYEGWFSSCNGTHICGAVLGEGDIPVRAIFDLIKASGYNGTVSLEYEGLEDHIEGITRGCRNLKKLLG